MTNRSLLALAAYPKANATTRFRVLAFERALREAGIELTFSPFVDEATWRGLHSAPHRQAISLLRSHAQRLVDVLRARKFDAVMIQREANIVGPPWVERLCSTLGIPFIYDIDDAVWLTSVPIKGSLRARFPRLGNLVRAPGKGGELIKRADLVICGSGKLAAHVKAQGKRTATIPTVPSQAVWQPLPCRAEGQFRRAIPRVGWIGTPSTAVALTMIEPALARLRSEGHNFDFLIRGAGKGFTAARVPCTSLPWREAEEPQDFAEIDIGVAPMMVDAWSNGKCAFKQIQYMACGVPFVSTAAGAVDELVVHGKNGLIAHTEEDWYTHLRVLLTDFSLRKSLTAEGLQTIRGCYSLEAQEPHFVAAIKSVFRA
jgi:glycosyltransferase involved in cell wall biosynthesis